MRRFAEGPTIESRVSPVRDDLEHVGVADHLGALQHGEPNAGREVRPQIWNKGCSRTVVSSPGLSRTLGPVSIVSGASCLSSWTSGGNDQCDR